MIDLKRKKADQYTGLEKPGIFPIGFGIAGPKGLELVTLSFYWIPPEDTTQHHVLFRVTMEKTQVKSLVDSLSEYLSKKPARVAPKKVA